jgi:hypothetical protein
MEYALFSVPIQAGKVDGARRFLAELEQKRKSEYAASEQRIGITKEVWAIQQGPDGDRYVVFFQSNDIPGSINQFIGSQDAFDLWFKSQVKETTGIDLNVPLPGPLSEILSVYEA